MFTGGKIMGDFNVNNIRWRLCASSSKTSSEFLNIIDDNFITQKGLLPARMLPAKLSLALPQKL